MDKKDRSKVKDLSYLSSDFKPEKFLFPLILLKKKSETYLALVVSASTNPIGVLS